MTRAAAVKVNEENQPRNVGNKKTKPVNVIESELIPVEVMKIKTFDKDLEMDKYMNSGGIRKHRTNLREILRWSNATPIRRFGDGGYMCCYCDEQFQEPGGLKEHTLDVHATEDLTETPFIKIKAMLTYFIRLDTTFLHCKICEKIIDSLEDLMHHLKDVHNKTIHTDIKNHIMPFKFNTETLECCICKIRFDKFKSLSDHMKTHYRNYICDVCDAGFVNYGGLVNHSFKHNAGTFKCDYCPKILESKMSKSRHELLIHKQKVYLAKCGYCDETFKDYRKKEAHLASVHGVQIPKCQACDREFKTRRLLNYHVRRDHMMERSHECTKCDMKFFAARELKNHMITHSDLKPYECSICLKSFRHKKYLKGHMRIHENDRRFRCELCGLSFIQKVSLNLHMKSRHGNQD